MADPEQTATARHVDAEKEVPEIAQRIMNAAIYLFGRKGYAATSVREIVQEADVTNPMLYYYFDSKEGLFRQILGYLFEYMQLRVAEIVQNDEITLDERLRAIVGAHLTGVRESPEVLRFVYSAIFGPADSRPDIDVHEMHMKGHTMVKSMFGEAVDSGEFVPSGGLDADQLTELLLGLINQELMRILNLRDHARSEEEAAELVDSLTNESAVDRIVAFFMGGAGTIRQDSKS